LLRWWWWRCDLLLLLPLSNHLALCERRFVALAVAVARLFVAVALHFVVVMVVRIQESFLWWRCLFMVALCGC
jgi:hypothetical protein